MCNMALKNSASSASEAESEFIMVASDDESKLSALPQSKHPRRDLFFVAGQIQNDWQYVLVDSGACRNLIAEDYWRTLTVQNELRPAGKEKVIAGNGAAMKVVGSTPI